jgi:diguanylate cyclase (GGDEF)-like protein
MDEWLTRHCRRADLRDEALSIALIDIDDMRTINDSYGYVVGDTVLTRLGDLMRRAVGADDLAARFGGEEFLLAWPGDDADEAALQADALRVRFHELEVELEDGSRAGGFTLSAGVAQLSTLGREERDRGIVEALVRNADSALQQAKEGGRDQVRIF